MTSKRFSLISDFNVEPLSRLLSNSPLEGFKVEVASFGQVYQELAKASADDDWGSLIWTLPEKTIPTFAKAMDFGVFDVDSCLDEVNMFAAAVLTYARHQQHIFVSSWALPPDYRGWGPLDWRPGLGLCNLLAQMNIRLAERLQEASNIYMLDAGRWLGSSTGSMAPKMWYAAKVPYTNIVFEHASSDIVAAIRAAEGRSRRLIVVDLDNTMWGGVVGETGWEGIRLGGHDHVGEAFRDFQRALKALSQRGIQLAISSKNDEHVAMEAIDLHPEMMLTRNDFAGWRINWDDKATNINALVQELNLGLDSVVFIDDNPAERDRVREALPNVMVPDWPVDPTRYVSSLRALKCFDMVTISQEDRGRTAMYAAERERRNIRSTVASSDDWLRRLETCLNVSRISASNIARVVQLFNKTNQLNLSTRRLDESAILNWSDAPGHSMLVISASDRFGDMGLVGIIGVETTTTSAQLVDFILSCRVMGRKVEETMLHLAASEAQRLGAREVVARYIPTKRNRPTLDVLRSSGLIEISEYVFRSENVDQLSKPDAGKVELAV